MDANEARVKISNEFIDKYYQFLSDIQTMESRDFGKKYGWQLESIKTTTSNGKDMQKSMLKFHKLIFSGRWLPLWVKEGYTREVIWELHQNGFLSYQWYSNWNARATGKTDFYYISQNTAKQIYKELKRA